MCQTQKQFSNKAKSLHTCKLTFTLKQAGWRSSATVTVLPFFNRFALVERNPPLGVLPPRLTMSTHDCASRSVRPGPPAGVRCRQCSRPAAERSGTRSPPAHRSRFAGQDHSFTSVSMDPDDTARGGVPKRPAPRVDMGILPCRAGSTDPRTARRKPGIRLSTTG